MNTIVDEKGTTDRPVFYRFSAEFRRIGSYLLVTALIIAATMAIYQYLGVIPRSWSEVCVSILLFPGSMCVLALVLLRQLLRVDDRGIWRRRLFRWDLWPWEAFAGEQVHQGKDRDSFVYPAKPWWNRYLRLEFLEEEDRKHLLTLIQGKWKPPPLPPIPAEITIRWGFRRWAHLSKEGIHFGKGKNDIGCCYRWWVPLLVRLTRLDHSRRDLREVEIKLPGSDRPIVLRLYKGQQQWSGATPEVLAAYLEQVVPTDCLLVTARTGQPRSFREWELRMTDLDRVDRDNKQLRWSLWVIWGLLVLGACVCPMLFLIGHRLAPNQPVFDIATQCKSVALCFNLVVLVILIRWINSITTRAAETERNELAAWREAQSQ